MLQIKTDQRMKIFKVHFMPVHKFMAANAALKMQREPKWPTIQYGGLTKMAILFILLAVVNQDDSSPISTSNCSNLTESENV